MLTDTARAWIDFLPELSINNWLDMQEAFTSNFEGTYKRAFTINDLKMCIQKKGESSREHLTRWVEMKNATIGINDGMAITAFLDGISSGPLRHKLVQAQPSMLNQLIAIATKYVAADDDARIWEEKMRRTANSGNKHKAPAEEKS